MQTPSQAIQPTLLNPISEPVLVAPQTSLHKYKHILDSVRLKKTQQLLQPQNGVVDCRKNEEPVQLIVEDPNVEHSRSRDKRKKKNRKQSKKTKSAINKADTLTQASLPEKRNQTIESSHNIINAVSVQNEVSQLSMPQKGGIIVIQDFSGLLTKDQYECGQIVEERNTQLAESKTAVQKLNQNYGLPNSTIGLIKQHIVYQGWREDTYQIQKDKHKKQDIQEEHKQRSIHHHSIPYDQFNDRLQRKNLDEKEWCYKSKMCFEFLRGRCKKSSNECTYAHGYDDLKQDRRNRFLCRNYTKGFCKKSQQECKFYHQKQKDRQINSPQSENDSSSDIEKKKQRKVDIYAKKEEQPKTQKRETLRQIRIEEIRTDRKQQARETRPQEKKIIRQSDQKINQEKRVEQPELRLEQTRNDKKISQINQQTRGQMYEMNPLSNYPFNKHSNSTEQTMLYPAMQMAYGFPAFAGPIYFSTFCPFPQPFHCFSQPNTGFSSNIRQQNTHNLQPNTYFPPSSFNSFYPSFNHCCHSNQCFGNQHQHNQTFEAGTSENEQALNNSVEEKRHRQRYSGRQRRRSPSKEKSRERKQKKHRR